LFEHRQQPGRVGLSHFLHDLNPTIFFHADAQSFLPGKEWALYWRKDIKFGSLYTIDLLFARNHLAKKRLILFIGLGGEYLLYFYKRL
jgi:hypothetical protein